MIQRVELCAFPVSLHHDFTALFPVARPLFTIRNYVLYAAAFFLKNWAIWIKMRSMCILIMIRKMEINVNPWKARCLSPAFGKGAKALRWREKKIFSINGNRRPGEPPAKRRSETQDRTQTYGAPEMSTTEPHAYTQNYHLPGDGTGGNLGGLGLGTTGFSKTDFVFWTGFRFTIKLGVKNREFPSAPWPHTCTASPMISVPCQTAHALQWMHLHRHIITTQSPQFTLVVMPGAVQAMGLTNV